MTLRHTGFCHMSKSRPQVATSDGGVWSVSMLVYDRIGPKQVEPWLIIYTGSDARAWWESEGKTLEAGDTLRVVLEKARVHIIGRERNTATAEMHAHVAECRIEARAHRQEAA